MNTGILFSIPFFFAAIVASLPDLRSLDFFPIISGYNRGMPIYDESDGDHFAAFEEHFAWMPNVLAVEYGEWDTDETVPAALDWPMLLPDDPRYDLDEVECSLVYENAETGYVATIWEASGENDLPWVMLLVDDFGVRLLSEYSVIDEDSDETMLDAALAKASTELPQRLLAGEFDRTGEPIVIPEWLLAPDAEDALDA